MNKATQGRQVWARFGRAGLSRAWRGRPGEVWRVKAWQGGASRVVAGVA